MKSYIRPYRDQDIPFLWEMLYQSIYVSEGDSPPNKEILKHPSIEKYLKDWGKEDDHALVAVDESGNLIGAIWIRKFNKDSAGYGFVDEDTPELGMAILPEFRGKGIGKTLLAEIFNKATSAGFKTLSLSVDPHNIAALRLYEKNGFLKVGEDDGGSWILSKILRSTL